MAVNINLLPSELKVSTGLAQGLKIVRMVGVIALGAFLLFGLGVAGFFIISTVELNNLNSTNTNLKGQLTGMSVTEQRFFILKDRISKIKTAEAIPSATKSLTDFEPFLSSLQTSKISELDITPSKVTTTINFNSNAELTAFMTAISTSSIYKSVTITSFGYNPAVGYSVSMSILGK